MMFAGGPWLWLSPKLAHDLGPLGLKIWSQFISASEKNLSYRPRDWRGLHFRNPVGIAGGVDKTGDALKAWHKFGAGFLELGTVTPLAQSANPGLIMDRDIATLSVWNKMGFPGPGADAIIAKLKSLGDIPRPLFINIGKNRQTPNEQAFRDYIICFEKLREFADAFVVNISSPNTSGLRQLGSQNFLDTLISELTRCQPATKKIPILLKLSPDMNEHETFDHLDRSAAAGVDGWILTNTTTSRKTGSKFQVEGGVSGAPLAELSKLKLQQAVKFLGNSKQDRLVISAGGIMTPSEVRERLDLGADLVQVYSTLIFRGPLFFRELAKYFDKRSLKI